MGVYCNEILFGLARRQPQQRFRFCYRIQRYFRSFVVSLPPNCHRFLLHDDWRVPGSSDLFHGLNQRLPRRRLRRSVSTFHDLFVMTGDYSSPEFRSRFTELARHAAERSDIIIAVSRFTADQVSSLLGIEGSRIRVVHHGVHPPARRSSPSEPVILHVGAIQHRKNIVRLVEAFEQLPRDWRLVLAGSAGYGFTEILPRIQNSPARDRIEVLGFVSQAKLADLYGRASILAFPSLDEGFGMPVLEGMAAGIPVVCSDGSALREVAGDAAILVDPRNSESIQDGLLRVIADSSLRETMISRGLARAAHFTWSKAVEETWEVYRELLS